MQEKWNKMLKRTGSRSGKENKVRNYQTCQIYPLLGFDDSASGIGRVNRFGLKSDLHLGRSAELTIAWEYCSTSFHVLVLEICRPRAKFTIRPEIGWHYVKYLYLRQVPLLPSLIMFWEGCTMVFQFLAQISTAQVCQFHIQGDSRFMWHITPSLTFI